MEFRVRKHVKNISRSLEKICDIIDEYAEDHPSRGGVIPDFLGLLPMRYRAGGCVIELTAMTKWDHEAIKKFNAGEISDALQMALDTAKRLPSAISDMALNRESSAWFSLDADVLEPIVSEMVGVIKAPSLDKTTFDCISILLRKEIQNLIDSKRDAAKERLKGGIENGRLTRSRFTRSDSPHTLTPGSSADSEPTFVGDIPSKIERSSRNTVWEELYDGCDGCADWGCAECAPQGSRSPVGSVMELAEGHASSVFVRQSPVSKRKNDSSSPRCFSQRPCSPETLPRHPRQYASSQTPCRRRRNSRVYVESEPSIVRRVQTMSLNDDSELESDIQVPEPKIYTATTTFPKSTQYPVPAVHIVDMKIEDVRNGDHYARRGKVTWSNGSIEAIWMDDLSKQYPQQLIQYYEKALPSENNFPYRQQSQPLPQAVPIYNPAHPNTSQHAMHIPPITSVHHPVHHPVPGAFGLQENNYVTQYQIPESFGMHGNNKSSANFGGNGYNATAGPAPSSMRFQSGVGNGLNPYNPAHATPRDTHYNSW